ncbi:MAG TPA: cupin domain-containing protein [Pricia sp.]|nr:cupin domain-containing protein [Pricia sp.]
MKRNYFVASILGLIAMPHLSFLKANDILNEKIKGFKVSSGEGRKYGHLRLRGVNSNVLDLKVGNDDTNGNIAIFEQTSVSRGWGTPLHVHHLQDEVFYVVMGSYYFRVGDETYRLLKGDTIFLPKKIPHAWTQVSKKGKMLVLFQPAGKMEKFFSTMSKIGYEPNPEEFAKIFADNDMQVVGPRLEIKKFGNLF